MSFKSHFVLLLSLWICGAGGLYSAGLTISHSTTLQKQKKAAQRAEAATGPNAEKEVLKGEAVLVLKNLIDQAGAIKEVERRAEVVASASDLLWKHDEAHARDSLSKNINSLLEEYEAESESQGGRASTRGGLDAALNHLLKAFSRRDARAAAALLERLQEVREKALRTSFTDRKYDEGMALAQGSLDADMKQSVTLAARVLEHSVPLSFPQYIYDLKKLDAPTADALYRKALTVLSAGQAYGIREAVYLSAYAFGERMVILPVADVSEKGVGFGIFTRRLSPPEGTPNAALAGEYLTVAYRFFNAQLQPGSPRALDPVFLGQGLFLVKKLGVYANKLGLNRNSLWRDLEIKIGMLGRNADLDSATLQFLAGYAERLATDDDVFQFNAAASSLERAKETRDKEGKTKLLLQGVWNLIQEQNFQEAERWLKEIEDNAVREQVVDLLHYRAGKAAAESRDWADVSRRASKINDARVRLLLLLEVVRAAGKRPQAERGIALQYLIDAQDVIPKVGEIYKAGGLIGIASVSSAIDAQRSREALSEAVKFINVSEAYDGGDYRVALRLLPDFQVMLVLEDSNFDTSFKRAAGVDWHGTISIAKAINSQALQSIAQVAACRAIL